MLLLLPALSRSWELSGAALPGASWNSEFLFQEHPAQADTACRALLGCRHRARVNPFNPKASPDTPHVTGTAFSCALVQDYRELHFIPSLELHTILDFFDMEEELFAVTNFIVNETKLKSNTSQGY